MGHGQEFNIFYLKGGTIHSESLSSYPEISEDGFANLNDQNDLKQQEHQRRETAKSESGDESIPLSINTEKVIASMQQNLPIHVAMQMLSPGQTSKFKQSVQTFGDKKSAPTSDDKRQSSIEEEGNQTPNLY